MNKTISDKMRKIIPILLLIVALCSCSKKVYVPVENVHTEYVYTHSVDTIMQKDSVYVREWLKGDTLYIEKTKLATDYKVKVRLDTVQVTDTIAKPYPIEVEKRVSFKERLSNIVALTIVGILLVVGGFLIGRRKV